MKGQNQGMLRCNRIALYLDCGGGYKTKIHWENLTLVYTTNFQPFSSHGTHKLITKIMQHT